MITPNLATLILGVATVLLIIIIPVLDGTKWFQKYISLRYTLVSVVTIMALGCILDFSHLAESSRNIVLMGAMILIGVFVLARTFEKLKLGNKVIDVSIEKGDIKAKAKIENKETKETSNSQTTDESSINKLLDDLSKDSNEE